jgi:hypothetical protein
MSGTTLGQWVTFSVVWVAMALAPPPGYPASSSNPVQSQTESNRRSEASKPKAVNPPESRGPLQDNRQTSGPRDQKQIIEEHLQQGPVGQPVEQGQVSERLDQFYKDSEERSVEESSTKRPAP